MTILWLVVPVALLFVAAAIVAYVKSARAGQFDDLETPAIRMLFDDEPAKSGGAGMGRTSRVERAPSDRG